jgi:hypothetical protein
MNAATSACWANGALVIHLDLKMNAYSVPLNFATQLLWNQD